MKQTLSILLFFFFVGCQEDYSDIVGEWTVNSKFYDATYRILQEEKELNGIVLYYNDGTTKYRANNNKHHYAFTGLKKKKGRYVDAISGATPKNEDKSEINLEITPITKDTLEVTKYIMNKPLKEIWIRNKGS